MNIVRGKCSLKDKKLVISIILCLIILSVIIIMNVILKNIYKMEYLNSTLGFIKSFNIIISMLGVFSCLISYQRTKDDNIFIISLMYIGLSVGILFSHIDYLPFYYNELDISIYIIVSASLLRISFLIISLTKENKFRNIILKNKVAFIFIVIAFTIIFGVIEKSFTINSYINNYKVNYTRLIAYNVFLILVYSTSSILLLIRAFKEKKYIFYVFSASILILALKAVYTIYMANKLSFYTNLVSVSLTYICFFIIIIGTLIESFISVSVANRLNEKLQMFYTLAEKNNNNFINILEENGNLIYANEKTREYYCCEDSIDKLNSILNDNKLNVINIEEIKKEIEENDSWRGLLRNQKSQKTFDCNIQKITCNNNKKYLAINYMEITQILDKESEVKKLKEYDKEKSEFMANISHELKTPLNLFSSSVQLMDTLIKNEDTDFRKVYEKYNKTLHLSCARMTRLIDNIMDLSKFDLGMINLTFNNYDIVNVVEEVVLSVVEYAKLKDIELQFDTNVEEWIIKCDANMIERLMLNLLSNAIKFSGKGSHIYVDLVINDEVTEIIVKDQGIGISKENQKAIFEKFVQVDKSFTRKNEGSGIGLSIVQYIVELHKGKIEIESELNKGTTFKVFLPNTVEKSDSNDEVKHYLDSYKVKLELSDIYEVLM
ncbi:ATP-binding protein [Clostridium sp. D53t1_180928_C8]|uniref:ATP-binding protein n=1 Tax=Clostridium sp. D53t1_180928_C8 TaxID=2787101 RepID=UPI0018AB476D|nr:ATP-binding protein [Clostridium sp. D53t1_180928_C8]